MTDMNVEPGTKPNPDPTVATNDAVERAMKSERDYVDGEVKVLTERLAGIDRATMLRLETIAEVPDLIGEHVNQLERVLDERFKSINKQLEVAEAQRLEQKEDSKTGLDAALAAQKEAASEQNKSNTLAISKSETATSETIKKLEDLFTTKSEALAEKIEDVKERVSRGESSKQGAAEQRSDTRQGVTFMQGTVAATVGLLLVALNLYGLTHKTPATAPSTPAVVCSATYHPAPCP